MRKQSVCSELPELVAGAILLVRGQRVLLDSDLASLYGVPVKSLVRAVTRNLDRFPVDFMFQPEKQEVARLRYQFGTSNAAGTSIRILQTVSAELIPDRCPSCLTRPGRPT